MTAYTPEDLAGIDRLIANIETRIDKLGAIEVGPKTFVLGYDFALFIELGQNGKVRTTHLENATVRSSFRGWPSVKNGAGEYAHVQRLGDAKRKALKSAGLDALILLQKARESAVLGEVA